MSSTWRDVRHALRQLQRTPGFTLAAIVSLALGTRSYLVRFPTRRGGGAARLGLVIVMTAAALLPARRAAGVDPVRALQTE